MVDGRVRVEEAPDRVLEVDREWLWRLSLCFIVLEVKTGACPAKFLRIFQLTDERNFLLPLRVIAWHPQRVIKGLHGIQRQVFQTLMHLQLCNDSVDLVHFDLRDEWP